MLDSEFDDDTELLAIADTLVSLGAPPTYRPPPLPVQPPQWANSAPTPAEIGGQRDLTLIAVMLVEVSRYGTSDPNQQHQSN